MASNSENHSRWQECQPQCQPLSDVKQVSRSPSEVKQKYRPIANAIIDERYQPDFSLNREYPPSNEEPFNIVVTGITGSGKTTLIKGITGMESSQANYGGIGTVDTKEVTPSSPCTLQRNLTATFWDTPGLMGGSEMLRKGLSEMKKKCPRPDMVIFCMKCLDSRYVPGNENPNVEAMKILTKHFGSSFWKDAIIALTFANKLERHRLEWYLQDGNKKQELFTKEIEDWRECVMDSLSSVPIPKKVTDTIQIIPVGNSTCPTLLNGDIWLTELEKLITRLQNRPSKDKLTEKKRGASIHESPFNTSEVGSRNSRKAWIAGLVGGLVGLLILPVCCITVPIGVVVGVIVGNKMSKTHTVNDSYLEA